MLLHPRQVLQQRPGLVLGAAFSLVLILLYFWSRGGQATDVRIVVRGGNVETFVDGKPALQSSFDTAGSGGISILVNPRETPPTLPSPSGIDHLTIRTLAGDLLFEESFKGAPREIWTVDSGRLRREDGAQQASLDRLPRQGGRQACQPLPWPRCLGTVWTSKLAGRRHFPVFVLPSASAANQNAAILEGKRSRIEWFREFAELLGEPSAG